MRFLLALFLCLLPGVTWAETPQAAQTSFIKGDVLYWEGEELVVKEISGREVRLHVNGETKIENVVAKLKTGDKIEATVTPQGHAVVISLQIPCGSPSFRP